MLQAWTRADAVAVLGLRGMMTFLSKVLDVFSRQAWWAAFINLKPVSSSRPRVGKHGTYYAMSYKVWRKEALPQVIAQAKGVLKTSGPLGVIIDLVCPHPKTVIRLFPRGDADNYCKGPLDVVNDCRTVWDDDEQVVALLVLKHFPTILEPVGTTISVYPMD